MEIFSTPANVNDFDETSPLAKKWNEFMSERFNKEITALENTLGDDRPAIAFFNPKVPPQGDPLYRPVTWLGFPNTMVVAVGMEQALLGSENPRGIKKYIRKGDNFEEISVYERANQDEYLEWSVHKDQETGKIKEITFTCEGPEYWDVISQDKNLLLKLYRKYASEEVEESDLFHITDIYRKSRDGARYSLEFKKGDYNIWNKWNLSHAIHLHQETNFLSAEVNIAASATLLRKKDDQPITDAHDLICCSGYGGPNRNSDPTIGDVVNDQVRNNRFVSLREPIGVYISDIDSSGFKKPDRSSIPDFKERYWNVIRGNKQGRMILRAVLRVPEGELFENRQLLLGDLLLDGVPIRFGGQVANAITVGLFATVIDNPNKRLKILSCPKKCCQNPENSALTYIQDINKECRKKKETMLKMEEPPLYLRKTEEISIEPLPSRTRI